MEQRIDTIEQALERFAEQIRSEAFAMELRKLAAHNGKVLAEIEIKPSQQGGYNMTLTTKAISSKNRKGTFLRLE